MKEEALESIPGTTFSGPGSWLDLELVTVLAVEELRSLVLMWSDTDGLPVTF